MNSFFLTLFSVQISFLCQSLACLLLIHLFCSQYWAKDPGKPLWRKAPILLCSLLIPLSHYSLVVSKDSDFYTHLYSLPRHLDSVAWFGADCLDLVHSVPPQGSFQHLNPALNLGHIEVAVLQWSWRTQAKTSTNIPLC